MKRALIIAAALTVALLAARPQAYLKLGNLVGDEVVGVEWERLPIEYFVTNRDVDGVSTADLDATLARAFDTWIGVPETRLAASFAGFTAADPFADDGTTVIGFEFRPEMDRTLGATRFEFDNDTGELIASDIFFNSFFDWSVAPNGDDDRFDLESVAVHEIGHLLGLGHSALGETEMSSGGRAVLAKRAVMFPIAYPRGSIEDRTIKDDDIAGLGDIYGTTEFDRTFGAVRGRVTFDGEGIFGAHVLAFNMRTGAMVGGFTLTDQGDFVITGLAPGLYIIRVEPLDDADTDSFFNEDTVVNIDFRPTYYRQLVGVPAGGAGEAIEIPVVAK
jgi:hypothetical protein